jgi:hypothetical protein
MVGLVEIVCEEKDALIIVLVWRRSSVLNDERPSCSYSLKANMGVVEVRPCTIRFGMDFVVEASVRCNGPLTDSRAVTEGGGVLRETMPVLSYISANVLLTIEEFEIP